MRRTSLTAAALALLGAACSTTHNPPPQPPPPPTPDAGVAVETAHPAPHVDPPASGPARDVHLPAVTRTTLPNGIEVNSVEYHTLPVLHIRLVVRAGSAADPANLPGLAAVTGDMLKEGTRRKTSAQIAEAIEFVGGSLDVTTGADSTTLSVHVLRDHAQTAFDLLAEVLTEPSFPQSELDKLRRRELDRLQRSQDDPGWLMARTFNAAVFGENHPYARVDTTADVLRRITRNDLVNFHRQRFVGGNMFLVVVGDITRAQLDPLLTASLGHVRAGTAPAVRFTAPPAPAARQIYLVDRPESPQSVIRIGSPSLRRRDDDYVPLTVSNHLLGGGAASRLFMDLRELRSLTYGAYSRMVDRVDVGSWFAGGQVRTPATGDAMHAFLRHLECATTTAAPDAEMAQTRSYLIDSFPLSVETPGNVADLISGLRQYGLADDYYDTYRTRIASVDPAGAEAILQRYVHLDRAAIVVVGAAEAQVEVGPLCAGIDGPDHANDTLAQQVEYCVQHRQGAPARQTMPLQEVLRTFGPVRVISRQGAVVRELTATQPAAAPVRAACEQITATALQSNAHAEAARPQGR